MESPGRGHDRHPVSLLCVPPAERNKTIGLAAHYRGIRLVLNIRYSVVSLKTQPLK